MNFCMALDDVTVPVIEIGGFAMSPNVDCCRADEALQKAHPGNEAVRLVRGLLGLHSSVPLNFSK